MIVSIKEFDRNFHAGASFGVQGMWGSSATTGAVLEDQNGDKYALTCHHACLPTLPHEHRNNNGENVESGEEEKQIQEDYQGVPEDFPRHVYPSFLNQTGVYHPPATSATEPIVVCKPSGRDTYDALKLLRSQLAALKERLVSANNKAQENGEKEPTGCQKALQEDIQKISADILKMEKDNRYGTVYRSSGYRVHDKQECSRDWGLIKLHDQQTMEPNKLPELDIKDLKTKIKFARLDGKSGFHTIADPVPGEPCYKHGRTTGVTFGWVSDKIVSADLPSNGRRTKEWSAVEQDTPEEFADLNLPGYKAFAAPGNSGSLLFNINGDVIGLIFGCRAHRAYFTPIRMVLEDIKAQTGLELTFL